MTNRSLAFRIGETLAYLAGAAICEPKVRLGRRRHDNYCDRCDDPVGRYACEKLDFPINSFEPDETTRREKFRAILDADYVRYCLECSVELERENGGEADV